MEETDNTKAISRLFGGIDTDRDLMPIAGWNCGIHYCDLGSQSVASGTCIEKIVSLVIVMAEARIFLAKFIPLWIDGRHLGNVAVRQ